LKGILVFFVVAFSALALLTSGFFVSYQAASHNEKVRPQFYVGVSYCGNTTEGAKLLIDRVKTYTNLFVLSNTPVSADEPSLTETCEYAVAAGLNFIVNLGTASEVDFENYIFKPIWSWQYQWLDIAKQRWGDKFLGVYYYDEPGGIQTDAPWNVHASESQYLTYDGTAEFFEWVYQSDGGLKALREKGIQAFTSDYALYWFDYLAGYDVILGELGWNQSSAQTIALVRGAATMQNKDWGTIITWTYNGTPYLDSSDSVYQKLLLAYECGAKYEVIFNYPVLYPENNPYGIMTDDHFEALERFWNDINVLSPEARGSNKAEAALVLPKNYGWGMRTADDKIWGAWGPDDKSPQIWSISRDLLAHYTFGLDIVYDDAAFPLDDLYPIIYLWNSTFSGGG
jgi:hypothetical protein